MDRYARLDSEDIDPMVIRERGVDRILIAKIIKTCQVFPLRLSALHFCFDNDLWRKVVDIGMVTAFSFVRLRSKTHYGKLDPYPYPYPHIYMYAHTYRVF